MGLAREPELQGGPWGVGSKNSGISEFLNNRPRRAGCHIQDGRNIAPFYLSADQHDAKELRPSGPEVLSLCEVRKPISHTTEVEQVRHEVDLVKANTEEPVSVVRERIQR